MFQSNVFDYVNVLDKAADASWLRNQTLVNNISNVDTPGYKRQDVAFEEVLAKALGRNRYQSMDSKVSNLKNSRLHRLSPAVFRDYEGFSYRLDKNNVDIENENVMLAENQLKYEGLVTSITQEFANLRTAMGK